MDNTRPQSVWRWLSFCVLLLGLSQTSLTWAVDTDGDGSDDTEEALAGTDPTNPNERPYWWKTIAGNNANNGFGRSVSDVGDVNDDGYADIVVGAPDDDDNGLNSGSVKILSGIDGALLYAFYGDNAGDRFGRSVSGAGDVNNDGYPDIIVGAPGSNSNETDSGSAQVLSGKDGAQLYRFSGDNAQDYFGLSVSGAGDVNKDGYADIIVGAPFDDSNASNSGSVQVYSGKDGALLYTFDGDGLSDYFGSFVSDAGDVNNDGYADIVVGAPYDDNYGLQSGSARVFSGVNGSVLHTFYGDNANDYLGISVSGAGDVNNDGYSDIVVGAAFDTENGVGSGSVKVYSGLNGGVLYTFKGDSADDRFGASVSGAGDVNNDGYADIIVGAAQFQAGAAFDIDNGTEKGRVQVLSGKDGTLLYAFEGDQAGDHFGSSVSSAGDIDNDGYDDILIGASGADINGADSGALRIILSSDLHRDIDLDFQLNGADIDTDGDGVNNDVDTDDDNDGILDALENSYEFLDPLYAVDAFLDQDGDGISNLDEIVAGTNPAVLDVGESVVLYDEALPGMTTYSKAALSDKHVYFKALKDEGGVETMSIKSVRISDSSVAWESTIEYSQVFQSTSVSADPRGNSDIVYVCFDTSVAYGVVRGCVALSVNDGSEIHRLPSSHKTFYAFDSNTGVPIFRVGNYEYFSVDPVTGVERDRYTLSNYSSGIDGSLYSTSIDLRAPGLMSLDNDGRYKWKQEYRLFDGSTSAADVHLTYPNRLSPTKSGSIIVILRDPFGRGRSDDRYRDQVLSVNAADGVEQWRITQAGVTSISVIENVLYAADTDSTDLANPQYYLSAHRLTDGNFLWRINISDLTGLRLFRTYGLSVGVQSGYLFVGADKPGSPLKTNGCVLKINPINGELISISQGYIWSSEYFTQEAHIVSRYLPNSSPYSYKDVFYKVGTGDSQYLTDYNQVMSSGDLDNDGIADSLDNCPYHANTDQLNFDGDSNGGDACDSNDDNDIAPDAYDPFPLNADEWLDSDGDRLGNNEDLDDDNDNVLDVDDQLPLDSSDWLDTDGDGIGNLTDPDDDNDAVADDEDIFPLDATESMDSDGDGIGNNTDLDDDNDGLPDAWELARGLDPFDPVDAILDTDGDGLSVLDELSAGTDITKPDTDDDGLLDGDDLYPLWTVGEKVPVSMDIRSGAGGHIFGRPVFDDRGWGYVAQKDGLYAFDLTSGERQWWVPLALADPSTTKLLLADGVLLLQDRVYSPARASITAYSAADPSAGPLWQYVSANDDYVNVAVAEGAVLASFTEGLYALDLHSGAELWRNEDVAAGKLAVLPDGDVVVNNDDLARYSAGNGALLWQVAKGLNSAAEKRMALDADGNIYMTHKLSSADGSVHIAAFSSLNGQLIKNWDVDNRAQSNQSMPESLVPVFGADGTLYLSAQHRLLALNFEAEQVLWEFDLVDQNTKNVMRAPVVGADGSVYVMAGYITNNFTPTSNNETGIYALHGATGELLWKNVKSNASLRSGIYSLDRLSLSPNGYLFFSSYAPSEQNLNQKAVSSILVTNSAGLADSPWPSVSASYGNRFSYNPGCTDSCVTLVDTDSDGIPDDEDTFPNDAGESADVDGDGIGDNSDLDSDNDGYTDSYELAQGSDIYSAASLPAETLILPTLINDFGDNGIAQVDLAFDGQFAGITVDAYQVVWINHISSGYLISGMFSDDSNADETITHHFLGKLDSTGAVDLSFGENGFVVRAYQDLGMRNDAIELSDGHIIWVWQGVVQKLKSDGYVDGNFNSALWSSASDYGLGATPGVYLPYTTNAGRIWGSLVVGSNDSVKVLGCRLNEADRGQPSDCDLTWFEISADASVLTSTDVGLDLDIKTGIKVSHLASGEALMHIEYAPVISGAASFAIGTQLYKLNDSGVLDMSVSQAVFGDQVGDRNSWLWFDDVIEGDSGAIYGVLSVNSSSLDWSEIRGHLELVKLDQNLNIDTTFGNNGFVVIDGSGVQSAAEFLNRSEPVLAYSRAIGGVNQRYLRRFDASGNVLVDAQIADFGAGYTVGAPSENRGYRDNRSEALVGAFQVTADVTSFRIAKVAIAEKHTAVSDFNNDGKSDLFWRNQNTGATDVWTMDGAAVLSTASFGTIGDTNWRVAAIADFDGDGDSDLLWHHATQGRTSLWTIEGGNVIAKQSIGTISDPVWQIVSTGDYDGDGDADVLWHHPGFGGTSLWSMENGVVLSRSSIGAVPGGHWLVNQSGDYNNDGTDDILWRNRATGATSLWTMENTLVQTKASIGTVNDLNWQIAASGDFDADGDADILWHHAVYGWTSLWSLDNASVASRSSIGTISDTQWSVNRSGDYDGDGNADLLWRNQSSGATSLWLLQSGGVLHQQSIGNISADWQQH